MSPLFLTAIVFFVVVWSLFLTVAIIYWYLTVKGKEIDG